MIRRATPEDIPACAAIKNAWIEATDWMPRVHPAADLERHYRETVFPQREVWVAGDPVAGYAGVDADEAELTALFVGDPGRGIGKLLLDHVKARHDRLCAWTFVANAGARRFYAREGFHEVRRTDGDNEEALADVLLEWTA